MLDSGYYLDKWTRPYLVLLPRTSLWTAVNCFGTIYIWINYDYEPSTLPFSIETSLIFKIMFYCHYYWVLTYIHELGNFIICVAALCLHALHIPVLVYSHYVYVSLFVLYMYRLYRPLLIEHIVSDIGG